MSPGQCCGLDGLDFSSNFLYQQSFFQTFRDCSKRSIGISAILMFHVYFLFSVNVQVIIIFSFESFSHQRKMIVFQWSLRDSKSPQVSRIFHRIQGDLNNAVVWMISIRPLITMSSSPSTKSLVTVASAPIIISIIVPFMLLIFSLLWQGLYDPS